MAPSGALVFNFGQGGHIPIFCEVCHGDAALCGQDERNKPRACGRISRVILPLKFHPDGRTFGQVVRARRLECGFSLKDLSLISGLSKATLSTIENDQTDPRLSTMMRLAVALSTSIEGLVGSSTEEG